MSGEPSTLMKRQNPVWDRLGAPKIKFLGKMVSYLKIFHTFAIEKCV